MSAKVNFSRIAPSSLRKISSEVSSCALQRAFCLPNLATPFASFPPKSPALPNENSRDVNSSASAISGIAYDSKLVGSMASPATTARVDWKLIWAQRGFRYFFLAMFVSLFGSGMNFTGVSWYILSSTHSTVKVSLQVIVVTLPGLLVPFLGGVLIDRLDRRYLGVLLDFARGVAVLATAFIAWRGHLQLWHLYAMTLITGTGSAMYSDATEATAEALETGENPEVAEAGLSLAVYADLKEGFAYLKEQRVVRALGVTHSIMMAGVVSANVVLVALANDILHAGARGLGFLEAGWASGAITGGLIASQLPQKLRLILYVAAIVVLATGHLIVPFVSFLVGAVAMQALFGFCRALAGVVAQSSLMSIVPRHFMGRTQSAMAILTTALQLLMSFSLGWIAQRISIIAGFSLLALMYGGASFLAAGARQLLSRP